MSSATEALSSGVGLRGWWGFYKCCSLCSPPLQVQHHEQLHEAPEHRRTRVRGREVSNTGQDTVKPRGGFTCQSGMHLFLPSVLPSPGAWWSTFHVLCQPPRVIQRNAYSRTPPLEGLEKGSRSLHFQQAAQVILILMGLNTEWGERVGLWVFHLFGIASLLSTLYIEALDKSTLEQMVSWSHDLKVTWKPLSKSYLIILANFESRLLSLAFKAFHDLNFPQGGFSHEQLRISQTCFLHPSHTALFLQEVFQDYTRKPESLRVLGSTSGGGGMQGVPSQRILLKHYLLVKFTRVSWHDGGLEETVKARDKENGR